jgi:hypothetical protein
MAQREEARPARIPDSPRVDPRAFRATPAPSTPTPPRPARELFANKLTGVCRCNAIVASHKSSLPPTFVIPRRPPGLFMDARPALRGGRRPSGATPQRTHGVPLKSVGFRLIPLQQHPRQNRPGKWGPRAHPRPIAQCLHPVAAAQARGNPLAAEPGPVGTKRPQLASGARASDALGGAGALGTGHGKGVGAGGGYSSR